MAGKRSELKNRLWRGGRLTNRLSRLRHFRGHGVHSPFIYSIFRSVFMSKKLNDGGSDLFEQLQALGVDKHIAVEVANLANYCNINSYSINSEGEGLIICTTECGDKEVLKLGQSAIQSGTAIVILSPYMRQELCNVLLRSNQSATIDRFRYLILLNNHLPKQHFRL